MFFNMKKFEELTQHLKNATYIHDGEISKIEHDFFSKQVIIDITNVYIKESKTIIFKGIDVLFYQSLDKWGNSQLLNSIMVETTNEFINSVVQNDNGDRLFFTLELFSGNEIYIVCKELEII